MKDWINLNNIISLGNSLVLETIDIKKRLQKKQDLVKLKVIKDKEMINKLKKVSK